MGYAIMRTAKLKGAGSIGGSIAHAYRERETLNADPERTQDNEVLVQYDPEKCRQDIEKGRTRSDNVEVVEVVLTTSPEWMDQATPEQKEQWKDKSMAWLKDEFGEENIQSAVLHKDETTDHISAHVTPIDEKGKLNAKHWLGGKKKCQEIQDRYADKVKDLGLDRGERGSKAKHQEVAKYYARVEKNMDTLENAKEVKGLKVPERGSGMLGGYTKDDMKRYGQAVGIHVRDQMREREKTLIAKIAELESDKAANRGNIIKNTTLGQELKRLQSMAEKWLRVEELHTFNPNIGKELRKGKELEREHHEREWLKKPPRERLADVDKRILKEKDPAKMKDLLNKRQAASEEIEKDRQAQRERLRGRFHSHDRGGMER